MEKQQISTSKKKKVKELHWKIQQWKSHFQIMDEELTFIAHLLDSEIFKPNTPNLFERLQEFKIRIKKAIDTKKEIHSDIALHENNLGGMLDCTDIECDLSYYRKHEKLMTKVDSCFENFQKLKSEIFNYTGGILKKA